MGQDSNNPYDRTWDAKTATTPPWRWREWCRARLTFGGGDLFGPDVPDAEIHRAFAVMAMSRNVQWQVVTAAAERMAAYLAMDVEPKWFDAAMDCGPGHISDRADLVEDLAKRDGLRSPLANVCLGVQVEDQAAADARIPHLLRCPAAVRFLSMEPLLGPVDLRRFRPKFIPMTQAQLKQYPGATGCMNGHAWMSDNFDRSPDWVIVGSESLGQKAGRFADGYDAAARSIIDQCRANGVPAFHKQMPVNGRVSGDPSEWPADLRVRQFPAPAAGEVANAR